MWKSSISNLAVWIKIIIVLYIQPSPCKVLYNHLKFTINKNIQCPFDHLGLPMYVAIKIFSLLPLWISPQTPMCTKTMATSHYPPNPQEIPSLHPCQLLFSGAQDSLCSTVSVATTSTSARLIPNCLYCLTGLPSSWIAATPCSLHTSSSHTDIWSIRLLPLQSSHKVMVFLHDIPYRPVQCHLFLALEPWVSHCYQVPSTDTD